MPAAVTGAALVAVALVIFIAHRIRRARAHERLTWQATRRQEEWTTDELASLQVGEVDLDTAPAA